MLQSNAEFEIDYYESIWDGCVERLERELDPQIFSAYIRPLKFSEYRVDSGEFLVRAPSRFVCTQLEHNFKERLSRMLLEQIQHGAFRLQFSVDPSLAPLSPSRERTISHSAPPPGQSPRDPLHGLREAHGLRERTDAEESRGFKDPRAVRESAGRYVVVKRFKGADSGQPATPAGTSTQPGAATARSPHVSETGPLPTLNPKYTFDNFVVGSSNQFCHAAALRVAEKPGQSYNPLFIYGGVGLGKTHLLHSIGNEALRRNSRASVLYMSSEAFTNELIQALRNAKMDEFKARLRNIEVLLIDDIQFICGKERTQEEFFHTFNALYGAKRQIVITSDKLPSEIAGIEERLQTRFSWGLTADLQAPDFETRVAILNRKALVEDFVLPEDVAHFIAEKVVSNVRELEGALTRLHAISSLQHLPINMKSALFALQPLLQPKTVNITIDDIKKAVALHFGLKVADIISKRRTKNLSFPRHIAMYLCRKHTTASYPEIGQQFGGRDHSSVIHAANVVAAKVGGDAKVKELVDEIERRLLGG